MVNTKVREFLATAKAMINNPKSVFSSLAKDSRFAPHFKFLIALWIVGSILTALGNILFGFLFPLIQVSIAKQPGPPAGLFQQVLVSQVVGIPLAVILGIVVTMIGTAFLHGWIKIFGGKGKFVKTFQLNVYSMIPSMLFGWVPIASLIASIYSIYLLIVGVQTLHNMSKRRAIIMAISLYAAVFIIGLLLASVTPRTTG